MKLRHTLAAAVATAALAPAALLAAPAAHATGEQPTAASSGQGTATTTPSPSSEADPAASGDEPGEPTTGAGDDAGTGADAGQEGGTGTGTGEDTGAGAGENETAGTTEGADEDAEEDATGDPGIEDDCAIDAADLAVTVADLPSKLVAGGSWSVFTLKLTNTTEHTLDEVYPILYAAPLEDVDRPRDLLRLQYRHPDTGKWTKFDEWTDGRYFGHFRLEAGHTAELQLRIRATAKAQDGDGFALVAGDYYNEDGTCGWSEEQWYDFEILAAGSDPGDDVPPAEPGEPGDSGSEDRPGKNTKPQGGVKELPVKGSLAETGSSSTLPLFALAGAAAVALGGGAVYLVRRRTDAGSGATA